MPGGAARHAARLPAPGADLAGRAHLARPRRLPGRRHGAGQDDHPDRAAPAPRASTGTPARRWSSARPACSATGSQELAQVRPGRRGPPLPRRQPLARGARPSGFVLTTYGTMRVSHEELAAGRLGPRGRRRGAARQERALRRRPRRCARSRATVRVALTGTPMENNLTELWSILDWVIPGLLGSRQAFRRVWAAPIEAGRARVEDAAVRRPDRAVPAAPPQVRPRHRARAAGQDRDRPPAAA